MANKDSNEPASVTFIGYVGGLGGEAIQTFEVASSVAAQGVPSSLIVPDLPRLRPLVERYEATPNLSIVSTDAIQFDRGRQHWGDVWKTLHLRPAPVVHLHTGDIALPRLTLLALDVMGMLPRSPRIFTTIHNPNQEIPVGSARARYWAQVANRRITRVISPSRHGRETQVGYGVQADRCVTLHNSIDVARFEGGDGARVRPLLNLPSDTPLVVSTARIAAQKRPNDTLDAFARALSVAPDAHLVMVGAGDLEADAKAHADHLNLTGRVHWLGHQNDVRDFLAASDVWIATPSTEHSSLSLLEALARGCAVVATFCPGNDEVLEDGKNSLTAPVGDTQGLGDALGRLLTDPALRARLGAAGRATARRFGREDAARRHLNLYRGILPATGTP